MISRHSWVSLIVVLLLTVASAYAVDQNTRNRERKDDERIRNEQRALQTAKDKLKTADQELKNSMQAFKKDEAIAAERSDAVRKLRETLKLQHEKAVGLPAARDAFDQAKAKYDELAKPILTALHATAEYQSAVESATLAKTKLESAMKDKSLSSTDREQRLAELRKTIFAPSELDKAAIDANEPAKTAKLAVTSKGEIVSSLHDKAAKLAEEDPQLKKALKELDVVRTAVDKAKAALVKEEKHHADAQRNVNKQQVDVERAKAMDRANDKKPR